MEENKKLKPKDKSVMAFLGWIASMTDHDFKQIVCRGRLNRREVAKGCDIGYAVLNQNSEVKKLLEQLETELRGRGVLPEPTVDAGEPQSYDQEASRRRVDASRLKRMEQQLIELQAENKELRAKISCFSELSTVLADLGRLPV